MIRTTSPFATLTSMAATTFQVRGYANAPTDATGTIDVADANLAEVVATVTAVVAAQSLTTGVNATVLVVATGITADVETAAAVADTVIDAVATTTYGNANVPADAIGAGVVEFAASANQLLPTHFLYGSAFFSTIA